ncbi:MAG: FAD-binding oxidoreductase [Deltaproteobacteria bacterium]|nr:FAD-binding oxidoreductase [Deltaproteobacteria bacterium]
MTRLAGWGGVPAVDARERVGESLPEVCRPASLTRGLGRSYGDASLPARTGAIVASTRLGDRVLAFDRVAGVLRAEAGFRLSQLEELTRPAGWVSPVVPGTRHVTLGGMVASDIHGKNHHVAGCFGAHVRSLVLQVADGRELEVGPDRESELFAATLGGMGLTGHILEVEVALLAIACPWLVIEVEPAPDLGALVARLRAASRTWPYTVAWADALSRGARLGRGIVIKGRWAEPGEAPATSPLHSRVDSRLAVPCNLPSWVLGPTSVRIFDALFYRAHCWSAGRRVVHPDRFFHALDSIRDWNRLYGARGFVQHQSVLPDEAGDERIVRYFETITRHSGASFLTVVKDCGAEGRGLLSFPRPGISVALDLPMRGAATQALVDALNRHVLDAGGRIYLAKDALTRREDFAAMEPRLAAFDAVRRLWDPERRLRSALSARLLGDPA